MTTRADETITDTANMQTPRRTYSLWRNRDFLLLWSGQTVSTIGSSISLLAYPLLVYALAHSAVQMGITAALGVLPRVALSLPAGVLVDRWNRKRMMIFCDVGRALALGSIPLAAIFWHLTIAQIYLTTVMEGSLTVFFGIAEQASLAQIVPREQMAGAVTRQEMTEGMNALLGPSLAGLLFALRAALPFAADAVSYAASVGSLLLIRRPFQEQRQPRDGTMRQLRAELSEGLRWLWHQPVIRDMTLMYGGLALLRPGYPLIVIVLAQSEHATPGMIGLIFAGGGAGAILGSLIAPHVRRRASFGQVVLGVQWCTTLLWFVLALAFNPVALGIVVFIYELIDPIEDVTYFSYRHAVIPDELKGRVISACRLFTAFTNPLAQVMTGLLLQRAGVAPTIFVFGCGIVVVELAATLTPNIRNAPSLERAEA